MYLDYTGGGLHAASQIDAHAELLRTTVLGNPHSNNPTSLATTALVEQARRRVREFFNASADDYLCVFTANASAALQARRRVVPLRARRHVRPDVRQPQLGQRHPRVRPPHGARPSTTCRWSPRTCGSTGRRWRTALSAADPTAHNLLAFPAQSNFSGVQHPLDLVDEAHAAGWDVLVDAAAFVPTNRLDVGRASVPTS